MPANYEMCLRYCFGDFGEHDTLRNVLATLETSVAQMNERVRRMKDSGETDDIPIEEWDLVEALLGCAFVACQGYIALAVGGVQRLHAFAGHQNQGGHTLTTTTGKKIALMKTGDLIVGSTAFTRIEVINSLANYFKHHDEWPDAWRTATGLTAHTVSIISSIGLCENSKTNLQSGLHALGTADLASLVDVLAAWRANLCQSYKIELQNLGLLKV